jgi:hypothetical protein
MPKLNPDNVPPGLRHLIPLAERWGIDDDLMRARAVQQASSGEREELRRTVAQHDDLLDLWLAGPESYSTSPSPEYLAFTHMRMASDEC